MKREQFEVRFLYIFSIRRTICKVKTVSVCMKIPILIHEKVNFFKYLFVSNFRVLFAILNEQIECFKLILCKILNAGLY